MTFPNDLYERAGRSTCDCPGWEDDAYGCSDCQDLAANVLNMAAPHVAAREAQARAVGRGEVLLRLDDVDGLANAMNQADGAAQGRVSPSWEVLSPAGKAFYRAQVETVRAYLLDGDVDPAMVAEFRRLWAEASAERGES